MEIGDYCFMGYTLSVILISLCHLGISIMNLDHRGRITGIVESIVHWKV